MAKKQLSEMTLEELKAAAKAGRVAVIVMGVSIGIMFLAGIFITIQKKAFTVNLVLPFAFMGIFFPALQGYKKTKAALQQRQA